MDPPLYKWEASPDSLDLDQQNILVRFLRMAVQQLIEVSDNLAGTGQIVPVVFVMLVMVYVAGWYWVRARK